MSNEVDVKRIKKLIQESEVKAAKAQGVIDSLEEKWKERFGEGSVKVAKEKLQELSATSLIYPRMTWKQLSQNLLKQQTIKAQLFGGVVLTLLERLSLFPNMPKPTFTTSWLS